MQDSPPKNQSPVLLWVDFTRTPIIYKPDFGIETKTELEERQSQELAETFAENWLYQKTNLPEKWA